MYVGRKRTVVLIVVFFPVTPCDLVGGYRRAGGTWRA